MNLNTLVEETISKKASNHIRQRLGSLLGASSTTTWLQALITCHDVDSIPTLGHCAQQLNIAIRFSEVIGIWIKINI